MPLIDQRLLRSLVTLMLFLLGLLLVFLAWKTLVTFLFAILFAYLLEPAVMTLQLRLHWRRGFAVAAIYVVIFGVLAAFLLTFGPGITHQIGMLADFAPRVVTQVESGQIAQTVGRNQGWSYESEYRVQQYLIAHRENVEKIKHSFLSGLGTIAGNLGWALIVPFLAIFFLMNGDELAAQFLEQMTAGRNRGFIADLLTDLHDVLARYIRMQVLFSVIAIVVYVSGLALLRLPYALALGVIAGLLEFIPVAGPMVAATMVLVTALEVGFGHIASLIAFLVAWRLVQDWVVSPKLMGGQVKLHPLVVLLGVFAGAEAGGIIGVYLSIPAIASLVVLLRRWRLFQQQRQLSLAYRPPAA